MKNPKIKYAIVAYGIVAFAECFAEHPVAPELKYESPHAVVGPENLLFEYPPRNLDGTFNAVIEIPAGSIQKWIAGDSGAFKKLPRYSCSKFKNITFLTHGIGNLEIDVALIISNGNVFTVQI